MMHRTTFNHAALLLQVGTNILVSYAFAKLLAYRFGTSSEKDGFDIAFSVPTIILAVGGFGFLSCVITTHVAKMLETTPRKIPDVFSTLLTYMIAACIVMLCCCALGTRELTAMLGPGLSPEMSAATARLIPYMLPLVITLGLSSYFGAVLTAYSVPITAEACLVLTRLATLGYALFLGASVTLQDIAIGLVVASTVAVGVEWYVLWRATGIRFRIQFVNRDPELVVILRQSASLLVATLAAQMSWAYARRVATLDSVGMNAALTYVLSVIGPVSLLLAKPVALTQGPCISRMIARGEYSSARRLVKRSLGVCLALSIAAAWGTASLASTAVRLLFGGGRFDDNAIRTTAEMLRYSAWSLPGLVVVWVVLMPMLTMKNKHASAFVLAGGYAIHLLVTAALFPVCGRYGIAAGFVIAANLQGLAAVCVVHRYLRPDVPTVHGESPTATKAPTDADAPPRRVDSASKPVPRPFGSLSGEGVAGRTGEVTG